MRTDCRKIALLAALLATTGLTPAVGLGDGLPRVVRAGINSPALAGAYQIASHRGTRVLRPDLFRDESRRGSRPGGREPAPGPRAGTEMHLDLAVGPPYRSKAALIGSRYDRLIRSAWRNHSEHIRAAAARHHVPEDLLLAVIVIESAGRPDAVSPKGAQGLMQLMPQTAVRFGVRDAFDPASNIAGGAALLSHLLRLYRNDPVMTLAAYNAGEGSVSQHRGVPPYAETQEYIPRVLGAAAAAKRLLFSTGL